MNPTLESALDDLPFRSVPYPALIPGMEIPESSSEAGPQELSYLLTD